MNKRIIRKYLKQISSIIIYALLVLALTGCSNNKKVVDTKVENTTEAETIVETETIAETETIVETEEQGEALVSVTYPLNPEHEDFLGRASIIAACDSNSFLETFEYGDIVTAEFDTGEVLQMPVCGSYDDVSPGELVLRAKADQDKITIASNYGALGLELGFAEKTEAGSEYPYKAVASKMPNNVTITLVEKGGYLDKIFLSQLQHSTNREDYPNLSDEDYGNFRSIVMGDIPEGVLYRASSPIDDGMGRSQYVDKAMEDSKIKSVINMTDSEINAKAMPGYDKTYYSKSNVLFEPMSMSFGTDTFNEEVADCIRFIAENDGPYLIHCVYGKDRTGLLCAIIESLCGADMKDILDDYYKTYDVLYNIEGQQSISPEQEAIIKSAIIDNLSYTYGTDVTSENHTEKTKEYLKSIGITDEELKAVTGKLSTAIE